MAGGRGCVWGVSVQSQADLSSLWCCSYDRLGAWPEGGGVCGACQSSLKLTCLHCGVAAMTGWGRGRRAGVCVGRVSPVSS